MNASRNKAWSVILTILMFMSSTSTAWSMVVMSGDVASDSHRSVMAHHADVNAAAAVAHSVPGDSAGHDDYTHAVDDCSSCAHCVALLATYQSVVSLPSPVHSDDKFISVVSVPTLHFKPPRSVI